MRLSAIASLGGVCLLFAATAAVGSTTTYSPSGNGPTGKQTPAAANAKAPQSSSGDRDYQHKFTRRGKSQKFNTHDRRWNFTPRGTYVLQHPDDWDPGAYFYRQAPGRQSIERRDWQQGDFAWGAARYHGTWYEQKQNQYPQLQPQQRRQVVNALTRLSQADRSRLLDRFRKLDREDRERMRSLFGIQEENTFVSTAFNKYQNDQKFDKNRKMRGQRWQRTGKDRSGRNPIENARVSRQRSGAGQFQAESPFFREIKGALQDEETDSLAAVHYAREHLTPQQRIAMFEPLLNDPGGSQEARNAVYLILIQTYRDMDDMQKSMQLARTMIAENHGFQD